VVYLWLEQYDSALICLHIADGLNPYNFSTNMKLAGTYSGAGDDTRAEAHWQEAAYLMPDDLECRLHLLNLYRKQARWTELDSLLAEVVAGDSLSLEILEPVARRQLEAGDTAAAGASCRQALKLGLDTAVIVILQQEFPLLRVIDPDWTSQSDSVGQ
jgi:tetratricopeptide (TPR) repeat protein